MNRILFVLILLITTTLAQKAPFTIETLYQLKNVSDPQIAPNGKTIVFTVTEYQLEQGKSNSDLYLIHSDGSGLRRLTQSESADFHPRWSPDGTEILFVSTRSNGAQAWVLPVDGGEARQITDFYNGVNNPEWAGTTGKIIFTSTVFPECGADQDCNKQLIESLEAGPLHAHMADKLMYRHWTFYKDGKRTHIITYDPNNKQYKDITPGDYDSPAFGGSFSVSGDGAWLCVESNRDPYEAETTNKDLYLINLKNGHTKNITESNEAYDGQPVFSPNGKYIAFQRQNIPTFEADLKRLAVYNMETGTIRTLSDRLDAWTEQYHWAPDSKAIYFRAHIQGHFPIFKVGLTDSQPKKMVDIKTADSFDLAPSGAWMVISRRTINHPSELVRANLKRGRSKRLTFFNKAIEDSVDLRPAEEMWIPSPSGKKIHTYVIKPHDFDPHKTYPLILNVHGGPQYQWYDGFRGDWQVYPGSGYIVAFPNPHGSTGYGQAFTDAISKDWAGKVYRDVMAVADSLSRLPYVDANRMGAMGWSYGGYMMMWLEGHTNRFKAIVSMMGVYDLPAMYGATEELWFPNWDLGGAPWENESYYNQVSPHRFVKQFKTPCLVITGEKDYRVPYTQSLEFFTGLQKMRVPSRLIVFTNDGHWPNYTKSMPFYYNAHLDWFHTYLGGKAAPYDMKKMLFNQAFENKGN